MRELITYPQPLGDDVPFMPLSMDVAVGWLRIFGETRRRHGDSFEEFSALPGHFLYATGTSRTGVVVWGTDDSWTLSIFSAARIRMRPTLELYRYVSRWRISCGTVAAPYVVEAAGGGAAVMCETSLLSAQLGEDNTANRLIYSSIDLIGGTAAKIGRDLVDADGHPVTETGFDGMSDLLGWWEIDDDRVKQLLRLS